MGWLVELIEHGTTPSSQNRISEEVTPCTVPEKEFKRKQEDGYTCKYVVCTDHTVEWILVGRPMHHASVKLCPFLLLLFCSVVLNQMRKYLPNPWANKNDFEKITNAT